MLGQLLLETGVSELVQLNLALSLQVPERRGSNCFHFLQYCCRNPFLWLRRSLAGLRSLSYSTGHCLLAWSKLTRLLLPATAIDILDTCNKIQTTKYTRLYVSFVTLGFVFFSLPSSHRVCDSTNCEMILVPSSLLSALSPGS